MSDQPIQRRPDGTLLPGSKLNSGGRSSMRLKRLSERIDADTDDFQTVYKKILVVAGDPTHKQWAWACEWLADRYLGPVVRSPKAIADEDDSLADATDEELLEKARPLLTRLQVVPDAAASDPVSHGGSAAPGKR